MKTIKRVLMALWKRKKVLRLLSELLLCGEMVRISA